MNRTGGRERPRPVFDAVEHFHQPERGYRFSEDALLLARFVDLAGASRAADFGAGCGVVGLSVLENSRTPGPERLFFVEAAPGQAAALAANLALRRPRVETELTMLGADWRGLAPADFGGRLDYVFANPPYYPLHSSRASPDPEIEAARREVRGGLAELVASLARLLRPLGRAALMLPARRRAELLGLLAGAGFEMRRLETVDGRAGPRLILAEFFSAAHDQF